MTDMLRIGVSSMQGWRKSMEDAHCVVAEVEGVRGYSLFGVFDGHNGRIVAQYAGEHLHRIVSSELAAAGSAPDLANVMRRSYVLLDEAMRHDPLVRNANCGSTAVTLLIGPDPTKDGATVLVCANSGDSRCVLARRSGAEPLSLDHKPSLPAEEARIKAAGYVVVNGRVSKASRSLALSRALGDFDFKDEPPPPPGTTPAAAARAHSDSVRGPLGVGGHPEQYAVTAVPTVTVTQLEGGDDFAILACDGVWDVMSSPTAVRFAAEMMQDTDDLSRVCEAILDRCCASQAGAVVGMDNETVIIVQFLASDAAARRAAIRSGVRHA